MTTLRFIDLPSPAIVGIVNTTPDSFSDGGKFLEAEAALNETARLARDGAAIVEFGAESTAPGSQPVRTEDEWRRLGPILSSERLATLGALISVDTYKAPIAENALRLGARIINDVSALRADPELPSVIAAHDALLIMMHSKDSPLPHVTDSKKDYTDVTKEIADFLLRQCELAVSKGIREEAIAVDPGMGRFVSHDPEYSWQLLRDMERFCELVKPFPVLVGVSRKGFLGGELSKRDPISQYVGVTALTRGASLVRTHDVSLMKDFLHTAVRMSSL